MKKHCFLLITLLLNTHFYAGAQRIYRVNNHMRNAKVDTMRHTQPISGPYITIVER